MAATFGDSAVANCIPDIAILQLQAMDLIKRATEYLIFRPLALFGRLEEALAVLFVGACFYYAMTISMGAPATAPIPQ